MTLDNHMEPNLVEYWPQLAFYNIWEAGISKTGAQDVNKALVLSSIRLREHDYRKAIDYSWEQRKNANNPATSVPLTGRAPDLAALEDMFRQKQCVVKKRSLDPMRGRWQYFSRDTELNRYVPKDESILMQEYAEFVYDSTEDPNWNNEAAVKNSFQRLLRKIPRLEDTKMDVLEPHKILALNGCFDLKTGIFSPPRPHLRGLFNTASIPLNLATGYNTPAFDALLADCFAGDEILMQRATEMIGALISPVKTKRSIFIFQGVGNGGKTRLARLVTRRILRGAGVFVGSDFSDLADENLKRADTPYSLVFIRDSVDKTVAPKQRSFLKSYGDSGYDEEEPTYKILVCTNHAICTGDNGYVEKPLKNRCVVLSFPREMDNSNPLVENFEELYLDKELPAIVFACLRAYSNVLRNGGQFSGSCELNAVVEPNEETTPQEVPKADDKDSLEHLLDRCFEPCAEADKAMNSGRILQILQSVDPSLQVSAEALGSVIKEHFRDSYNAKRTSAGMVYNLRVREDVN